MIEKNILNRVEKIVKEIREKQNWVCFGAGRFFYDFINRYCTTKQMLPLPKYVCDNNEKLWGKEICGVKVVSPMQLKEEEPDEVIIAMSAIAPFAIEADLLSYKMQRHYFFIIPLTQLEAYFYYMENEKRITLVYDSLADTCSKESYAAYWRLTINGIMNYAEIYSANAYWNNDIVPKLMDGWDVLYAGAFDGKHIDRALDNNDNIIFHGFEPNKKMYEQLVEKYNKKRNVKLYPYALDNKKEILDFDPNVLLGAMVIREGNAGGVRTASSLEKVNCSMMDEEIQGKLDLIALDIEGSELEALEGAKRVIQTYKPILGICVYHRINHYVDIPLYIKELNSEYKLMFRHHSVAASESVIYAVDGSSMEE